MWFLSGSVSGAPDSGHRTAIDDEFGAVYRTRAVRRQECNHRSDLVRRYRAAIRLRRDPLARSRRLSVSKNVVSILVLTTPG